MSKQLTLDEMLIAAANSDMPGLDKYLPQLEALAQELGTDLAQHLGIEGPVNCDFTAEEGCGILGGFAPLHEGQPVPEVLRTVDTTGDWVPREQPVAREVSGG
jgi:hypothetical protein